MGSREILGFRSSHKNSMAGHMRTQHNTPEHTRDPQEKSNKCTYCDYASRFKQNLVRHIKVKHDIVIPTAKRENRGEGIINKCDQCSYSTLERRNLLIHMRKQNIAIMYH